MFVQEIGMGDRPDHVYSVRFVACRYAISIEKKNFLFDIFLPVLSETVFSGKVKIPKSLFGSFCRQSVTQAERV